MIKIEVKKSNKCNGDNSLFVSFPYNQKVVDILRDQIIRYWLPEEKQWELPIKAFSNLVEEFDNNQLKYEVIDEDRILNQKPKPMLIPRDYQFKVNPFNHQIEGIEYGLKYDRFLLGDEQGLGKTMQVINIACIKKQQKNYRHCLIICGVNGLKWNWKAEVEKHSNESAYILGTRYDKKGKEKIGSLKDRCDDLDLLLRTYDIERDDDIGLFEYNPMLNSYFIITNIETLRNEEIIEKLKQLCNENIINMIALDERS